MKNATLLIFASLSFCFSPIFSVSAELPRAPFVLDSESGGCEPKVEICGDGIDQDCNGSDLFCPGSDSDLDGYTTNDCNDKNRYVYPGIAAACSAECGEGTQTCQPDGTFTSCSCTPLCEATGAGKCYYVSKLTGSDSNPGTFQQPLKTYLNFTTYYNPADRPPNWFQLQAGDVVYFLSGVYDESFMFYTTRFGLYLRGINGTATAPVTIKSYPGTHPVFSSRGMLFNAINIFQSSNFVVQGIEITKNYGAGLAVVESQDVEIRNVWVHDTDGVDNNNIAGVYVSNSTNVELHHSLIHDNYDRTNADTGGKKTANSRNIVFFQGGNNKVHHSVIFQTPPITADKSGACIHYKHAANLFPSIFEVNHNIFWNCAFTPMGSGTSGTRFHHNLVMDSGPLWFLDHGGSTRNQDNIVEFNTIVRGSPLSYNPTNTWYPIGSFTFRNNIVSDDSTYMNSAGLLTIHTYGSDQIYNETVTAGNLSFSGNCYHNQALLQPIQFNLFAANGGSSGSLGGIYSFSGWQGLGYDTNSINADPELDSHYRPQNAACANAGWQSGW